MHDHVAVHASKIKQQIYIPQVNCSVGELVINTNLELLFTKARCSLKLEVFNLNVYTKLWLLQPQCLHNVISYGIIIIVSWIRDFL